MNSKGLPKHFTSGKEPKDTHPDSTTQPSDIAGSLAESAAPANQVI